MDVLERIKDKQDTDIKDIAKFAKSQATIGRLRKYLIVLIKSLKK